MDSRRQDANHKPNIIQIVWACGAAGVIYLALTFLVLRFFGLV